MKKYSRFSSEFIKFYMLFHLALVTPEELWWLHQGELRTNTFKGGGGEKGIVCETKLKETHTSKKSVLLIKLWSFLGPYFFYTLIWFKYYKIKSPILNKKNPMQVTCQASPLRSRYLTQIYRHATSDLFL